MWLQWGRCVCEQKDERGRHSGVEEGKRLPVVSERKERPRRQNRWKDGNKGSGLQRIEDGLK